MNAVGTDRLGRKHRDPADLGMRRWLPWLVLPAVAGLLALQAFAYAARLPLSLGPHVILEPWLLLQGYLLYEEIADLHSPLLPLLLSGVMPIFPDGLTMAKTVLVLTVSLSTFLTFLAGKRDAGWVGGLWAARFARSCTTRC
jgi:hypothetical protein